MGLHTILMGIIPDRLYTVNEAARFLCVHRCTIYAYINHQEKPLPFVRQQGNRECTIYGTDRSVCGCKIECGYADAIGRKT